MSDAVLVREARGLGLDERNIRILPLLLLVQLAWVGGDPPERRSLRRIIGERYGLDPAALMTVDSWLAARPSPNYLARARSLVMALVRRQRGRWTAPAHRADLVEVCRTVLRAVHSVYGIRRLTTDDERVLDELCDTIGERQGSVWPEIDTDSSASATWQPDEDEEDPPTDVGIPIVRPARPVGEPTLQPAPPRERITLTRMDAKISTTAVRGEVLTIGRTRGNSFQILDDGEVSRNHSKVYDRGGIWIVEDLGSMNGTRVNGEIVGSRQLFGDEEILIGNGVYRVLLE